MIPLVKCLSCLLCCQALARFADLPAFRTTGRVPDCAADHDELMTDPVGAVSP